MKKVVRWEILWYNNIVKNLRLKLEECKLRKTKIVCTIGPASEKKEVLVKMIKAGMNVARINFSHGNFEEQKSKIEAVKAAREEAG